MRPEGAGLRLVIVVVRIILHQAFVESLIPGKSARVALHHVQHATRRRFGGLYRRPDSVLQDRDPRTIIEPGIIRRLADRAGHQWYPRWLHLLVRVIITSKVIQCVAQNDQNLTFAKEFLEKVRRCVFLDGSGLFAQKNDALAPSFVGDNIFLYLIRLTVRFWLRSLSFLGTSMFHGSL